MIQDTDEYYMGEALKEAQKAFDKREVPVGAVIVYPVRKGHILQSGVKKEKSVILEGGKALSKFSNGVCNKRIIGRAHNQIETLKDATAHAEMIAITQAASTLGDWRLSEATIYVTKEPCPMCAGAMVNSRIKKLVFGVSDFLMGAAGGLINIVSDSRLRHQLEVIKGVKEEECRKLLQEFFSFLRMQK